MNVSKTMAYWYPFRSREVAEITSHLTADERQSLRAMATNQGRRTGWFVGIAAYCAAFLALHFIHSWVGFIMGAVAAAIVSVIFGGRTGEQRKDMKEFLCSTEYAKQTGYKPESLRLYQWWWS